MPYQADAIPAPTVQSSSTPAASTTAQAITAQSAPAPTATGPVTVIPAVDLFLGTVTIMVKQETLQFRHPQPQLIAQALAQAVRPTRWCGASKTLTVTVAALGKPAGVERLFAFHHQPA